MGALSVVICAILSHFFLGESLTTFGIVGCALCIVGLLYHVPLPNSTLLCPLAPVRIHEGRKCHYSFECAT